MKVLLFTHEQDIDGMGNVILCKQAFKDFDYVTCKTFEVNKKVQEKIDDKSIYKYDFIYVTDICIKEPLLSFINNDEYLKDRLIILDHHKSEIDEGNDKYDFVHIVIEDKKCKVSGTSLFYEYLLNNKLIKKTKSLDDLVEWTRQYDTWEWKKYNNPKGRMLHILFEVLGYKKYIEIASRMVLNEEEITFLPEELKVIDDFIKQFDKDVLMIIKDMKVCELVIDNIKYRIGYVRCPYKYRNDINEVVMKNNINDIDVVGMIMTDTDTVSYRNVKDIDASKIGVYFGGKGHKSAASNPQDNVLFKEIVNNLYVD